MIKWIFLLMISSSVFAGEPLQWSYINSIKDQHEFYQNNEVISKPQDAWQVLFSLHFTDGNFKELKDCVFYKVPGTEAGVLKIKTLPASESCDDYVLKPGDTERRGIKSLSFIINTKGLQLDFTLSDFKSERWTAELSLVTKSVMPVLNSSSAAYKTSGIILLAPEQKVKTPEQKELKENTLCHNINDDCTAVSASNCNQCPEGWYEIPNGCSEGPKYCGILKCGHKNGPACRRGLKWQRRDIDSDCRVDSSFAYCNEGLSVFCEGRKAFCR